MFVSTVIYEQELNSHIQYLEESMKRLQGVWNGCLIRNDHGDVIDRVGRVSFNPPWYQEAYRIYGRKPTKVLLVDIAKDHLDNGFWDIGGFVPPLADRLSELGCSSDADS